MGARIRRVDNGLGISFFASTVIHLTVFLLLFASGKLFHQQITMRETYYVDVVNLPVAHPKASAATEASTETPAPASKMTVPPIPAAPPKKPVAEQKIPDKKQPVETDAAFAERMAKLQKNAESRQEEAIMEKIRARLKAAGTGKGAPAATGKESGSRYSDYIKSRLEDALKLTSSYSTKNPEVAVRMTISQDGKLLRMKIEKSSGDAAFELSVRRAIDLASEKFIPPPDRSAFESGFIFKPKGISN